METFSIFVDYANITKGYNKKIVELDYFLKYIIKDKNFLYKCVIGSGIKSTIYELRSYFIRSLNFNDCIFESKGTLKTKEENVDTILYAHITNFISSLTDTQLKNHTIIIMSGDGKINKHEYSPSIHNAVKHAIKKCKTELISWKSTINRYYKNIEEFADNFNIIYIDDIEENIKREENINKFIDNLTYSSEYKTNLRNEYNYGPPHPPNQPLISHNSLKSKLPIININRSRSPIGRYKRNDNRSRSPIGRYKRNDNRSHSPIGRYKRNDNRSRSPIGLSEYKPQHNLHNYKTKLCNYYNTYKGCRNGSYCNWAHGKHELKLTN